MTNIQTSISVPIDEAIENYGYRISFLKRGFNGEACELEEVLGSFDHSLVNVGKAEWLEHIENHLLCHYSYCSHNFFMELSELRSGLKNIIKQKLTQYGYFKELKKETDDLIVMLKKYEVFLANPLASTPMKKLMAEIKIPKYSLDINSYYYLPVLFNGKFSIRRLAVFQTTIERLSDNEDYTYNLSYILVDVDNPTVKIDYMHSNLLNFDGLKWGNKLGKNMLFITEEAAKNEVNEFYKMCMNEISLT